jgi:hypothetical protein
MVAMGIVVAVVIGLPMGLLIYASSPWDTVPSTAEAVDVWQVGDTNEKLTLYPSHKMTFSNLPEGIFEGDGGNKDGSTPRISGTGKWDTFSNKEGYGPSS